MSTQPTEDGNHGLAPRVLEQLHRLAAELTPAQLSWVGGYFTGLGLGGNVGGASADQTDRELTILYGSQTGHARSVAEELDAAAKAAGMVTRLVSMGRLKPKDIRKLKYAAVVVSTQGEGDPPDDARELVEYLHSNKAPELAELHYCVLALGDSSYEFYCQTGRDFDRRLEELGGQRILDRVDLDVDFDEGAEAWIPSVLEAMKAILPEGGAAAGGVGAAALPATQYSRKHPLKTKLLTCQKITGLHSEKDIRHIEIDIRDSGLTYRPGDSLGIWFRNDSVVVDEILRLVELDSDAVVRVQDEPQLIRDALIDTFELTQLHPGFVTDYAALTGHAELAAIGAETETLRAYIETRQIVDVVREYPAPVEAQAFVGLLRRLTPRLYSIASSQLEYEDEVHLTVGVVEYEAHGHYHLGGATGYLAHRLREGEEVLIYVESNDNFRLPADDSIPVIMIGPGTGVAPFRAFVQERAARDAAGDNWLFFGNPRFTEDFLYQTEWQEWLEEGVLTHIDLAFSRDQEQKIYVQQRIAERADAVWAWLQRGAHVYVCGDESRMAHDVHRALVEVAVKQGGLSEEAAEEYLAGLRREGRYQRDVY